MFRDQAWARGYRFVQLGASDASHIVVYCVEFEVLKASKACRKEDSYKALKEGERVCVRCEAEALHEKLGWRCQGHGVEGRVTRWSALSAPHCHGKWLRAQAEPDRTCTARTCKNETQFIFV
ncbi:hypothetical protein NQ315_000162 [Exocentrus adspersus]|uniref:SBSPON-like C-terminal domain-containing protein n=1 Tax=Exocentrus adspersus TaxID=1586481 RepID=A0AAV8VRL4_9CUCU|nr:hypothetical protein NQ315_000162 [Exocentrus adspersus]